MNFQAITISTQGERFYSITEIIQQELSNLLKDKEQASGLLCLFIPHTSCGLTITEAFDPSATNDMENFLKTLAPRNLDFIQHTTEGPDDSPSHMKSLIIPHSLTLIIESGKLVLGTWQGIFLCEFRDAPKSRTIYLKFLADERTLS